MYDYFSRGVIYLLIIFLTLTALPRPHREVKASLAVVRSAVQGVQEAGALNYYGMQRFGTHTGHTHTVGRFMLSGQWDQVRGHCSNTTYTLIATLQYI